MRLIDFLRPRRKVRKLIVESRPLWAESDQTRLLLKLQAQSLLLGVSRIREAAERLEDAINGVRKTPSDTGPICETTWPDGDVNPEAGLRWVRDWKERNND